MAIARDNFTASLTNGPSPFSASYANAGNILFVFCAVDGVAETITGVTFNGTSLTQINKVIEPGARWWYLYALKSPAVTTANITVTAGAAINCYILAASYTGADTTTNPEDNGSTSSVGVQDLSINLTAASAGDWSFAGWRNDSYPTSGTSNLVDLSGTGTIEIGDSNGSLGAAGVKTLTIHASNPLGGGMFLNAALIKASAAVVRTSTLLTLGVG